MIDELWCIVTVSSAEENLTSYEAEQMISYARKDRLSKGITSLVLYCEKNILVVLEGKKTDVRNEFQVLMFHSGHNNLIKMYDQKVPERFFGDYPLVFKSMSKEFRELDDFQEPEQLEYFDEFLSISEPIPNIVRSFIKNNG